ncbi:GNAT family N-acetyltransferase [Sphingomonas sp. CFBP 13728]|uniref:GNAT family N-acetyltransferase n=1 Tax=Sphingomonas sp. CFBP 13728 TaxID=2775294 RepID=UPI003158B741
MIDKDATMVELVSERATAPERIIAPSPPVEEPVTWSTDLVTRSGYVFHVRPASPSDEAALGEFFTKVDKEDLRFRFLSAIHKVDETQLKALVTVDHEHTENFLAFEYGTDRILATAMLAADETLTNAEVAVAIRADFKRLGISWTLLDHVAKFARAKGIRTLESIESRDNHQAIDLERERGWIASACPGDSAAMILRMTL